MKNGVYSVDKNLIESHNCAQKALADLNFEGVGGAIFCNLLMYGSKIVCVNKGDCHAVLVDSIGGVQPITKRIKQEKDTAYSNFGMTKSFFVGLKHDSNIVDSSNIMEVTLKTNSIAVVIATEGVWRFVSREKIGTIVL